MLCGVSQTHPFDAANFLFFLESRTDPSVTALRIYGASEVFRLRKIDEVKIRGPRAIQTPPTTVTDLTDSSTYWFAISFIYASGDESELHSRNLHPGERTDRRFATMMTKTGRRLSQLLYPHRRRTVFFRSVAFKKDIQCIAEDEELETMTGSPARLQTEATLCRSWPSRRQDGPGRRPD